MIRHVNDEQVFPLLEKIGSKYDIPADNLKELWSSLSKLHVQPTSQYYKLCQKKQKKNGKPWRQLTARQQASFKKKQFQELKTQVSSSANETKEVWDYVEKKYQKYSLEALQKFMKNTYHLDANSLTRDECLRKIIEIDFDL